MASTDDVRCGVGRSASWRDRVARPRVRASIAVVIAATVAATVYAAQHDAAPTWPKPHPDATVAGIPVAVGTDVCGTGWTGGRAGRQTFALWNSSIDGMEVYLRDVATGTVYLDLENLGAGATRSASVTLGPGRYQFYCLGDDASPLAGRAEVVTGAPPKAVTPGLLPLSAADLIAPTQQYQHWIATRLPVLQRQVAALAADVRVGDRGAAKRAWLTAHRIYETLGGAYGAFGKYDAAINGDGRGFHLVEAQLWRAGRAGSASAERRSTTALEHAVAQLRRGFPKLADQMGMQAIGLRSHEILENAIQLELTGATDAGSHTELATIDANLTGTLAALKPLRPMLAPRDPDLATTDAWIARAQRLVRSYRHRDAWTALTDLTRAQREELDATLEQTVEYLSQVAVITEPRRTNQ